MSWYACSKIHGCLAGLVPCAVTSIKVLLCVHCNGETLAQLRQHQKDFQWSAETVRSPANFYDLFRMMLIGRALREGFAARPYFTSFITGRTVTFWLPSILVPVICLFPFVCASCVHCCGSFIDCFVLWPFQFVLRSFDIILRHLQNIHWIIIWFARIPRRMRSAQICVIDSSIYRHFFTSGGDTISRAPFLY